ncbi:epididymal-specific lipocalin-12 [Pteronotus mesoamericanus]|uniref:epididymal-specific lipocalin-12 n=1 Tax=Pteronotus mesoamericanus TaxID=1884717 RepID=UPI0023EBBEF2|nr:epididymal-specific lipocalin-12 [Pteronotus parnellii mesoamericanus]
MGLLCALWVALALPEALQGQPRPSPGARAPVLQSFQEDQFQGHWFVLGLAGSTYSRVHRALLGPFTATFEQKEKKRLEVSYAMTRGRSCITWSYVLIPAAQPGKFSVDNSREPEADAEELQVHSTDYTTFALMVSRRQSRTRARSLLRVYLLCRMWAVETQALDRFACLLRAQGLTEDNVVFPGVKENVLKDEAAPTRPCHGPALALSSSAESDPL